MTDLFFLSMPLIKTVVFADEVFQAAKHRGLGYSFLTGVAQGLSTRV